MSDLQTTIPKGSTVLITGATGHIAAHTAKMFLERGFKVRGTVRDLQSAQWLLQGSFKPFADSGDIELVHVPDLGVRNAFDEAIKGTSAIVHVASNLSFSDNPHEIILPGVDCIKSILKAAQNEPSVKSVVYTSSMAAAVSLTPGVTSHAGPDVFNEEAVKVAWSPPPHPPDFWHIVYHASKVEAEKAVWEFLRETKPHFSISVVSPATVLGEGLAKKHLENPYPWTKNLYDGNEEIGALFQAIVHVDVKDTALLHVAAVLDPDCNGARLQAWGGYCNMNDMLAILRKMYPQRKFRDDFMNQTKLSITADPNEPLALLKKWGGKDGWTPLEQSIADEMKGILE